MSNHQHDLDCLEGAGGVLYCKVTGDIGVAPPSRETASTYSDIDTATEETLALLRHAESLFAKNQPVMAHEKLKQAKIHLTRLHQIAQVLPGITGSDRARAVHASRKATEIQTAIQKALATWRSSPAGTPPSGLPPGGASVIPFPGTSRTQPTPPPVPTTAHVHQGKRAFFNIEAPLVGRLGGGGLAYQYSLPSFEVAKGKAIELLMRKTRTPYFTIVSYVPGQTTTRTQVTRAELGPEPATFYVIYGKEYDLAKSPPIARADTINEIKKLAESYLRQNPERENVNIYAVTPGRGSPIGRHATTVYRKNGNGGGSEIPKDLSRNNVIRLVKQGLKKRSGKEWSVTGGQGTAYGWINISAPPKRLVKGYLSDADANELGKLLNVGRVHSQGHSVASSHDYYIEIIDRAWGRTPRTKGVPYWD
jgi:hypothetical protein